MPATNKIFMIFQVKLHHSCQSLCMLHCKNSVSNVMLRHYSVENDNNSALASEVEWKQVSVMYAGRSERKV